MKRAPGRSEGLFLVGTCHWDPHGLGRCRTLLDLLAPDVVLVEVSPFAVWIRKEHRRFFLRLFRKNVATAAAAHGMSLRAALCMPAVRRILRQCALPFEWRAARNRHAERGTPYFCVDRSDASRLFVSDWPHWLSSDNLKALLRSNAPVPPSVAEEYGRARAALSGITPAASRFLAADGSLWERRERWLEQTVRATLRVLAPTRLVYLGGWSHVVPNAGVSLFDRLRDCAPVSLLLDEVDGLEKADGGLAPQPTARPGPSRP
uniref:Uncharacterized protein n=1 Tax=Desulfacinum infernum TaxID=35837 RepID=A0A832A501_9BACT